MHTTELNGITVTANASGNPKAYMSKVQATTAAKKVNGKAFQIRPNGGCFYVQVSK